MAGRASIVGAAATHVGNVREHNEDAHFFDADLGLFVVCDGMGGHAAGEVASAIAIESIRDTWASDATLKLADAWAQTGAPDTKRQLLAALRGGVTSAHAAILDEAERDLNKSGMGTTLVGAMVVGNELVFAHAGDSRAYMVRDGIAMQLTEDHTLLARLLAAGIDVDTSGEGARFRSMLTNALGIGQEVKVATFIVPLADGDRFLLCSDGVYEYVPEAEIGEVLTKSPSPARSAQKLIELALERGGNDNCTALVVRVLEAGDTPQPSELRRRDDAAIDSCPLWSKRITPQQRLRALRITTQREYNPGERLPAHAMGDRVAWIVLDGQLVQDSDELGPGALVYPESLLADSQPPPRDLLAVTRTDVRALAMRADDFRELCEDDNELAEALLEGLTPMIAHRLAHKKHIEPPEPLPPPEEPTEPGDESLADDEPVELEMDADEPGLEEDSIVDVEAPPDDEDPDELSQPEVRIELRHDDDEELEIERAAVPDVVEDELDIALESALDAVVDKLEPPPRYERRPTMPPVNVARGGAIEVAEPRTRKPTPPLGSRITPAVGVRALTPHAGVPRPATIPPGDRSVRPSTIPPPGSPEARPKGTDRVARPSQPLPVQKPPEPPELPEIEIENGQEDDDSDEPEISITAGGDDDDRAEVTTPQAAAGSGKIALPPRPRRLSDNWDD